MRPFAIDISQATLDDLHDRLARTRWPSGLFDAPGWEHGVDAAYLRALMTYWREQFDWRAREAELNRRPQLLVEVDGAEIHVVHQPGRGPEPLPLLLTHGWPSTFAEFRHLIGPLTDPVAHGGDARDAFDVVVPSLPGYVFSEPLPVGRWGDVPRRLASLMERLGYDRFAAHGGDIGGFVTNRLAVEARDRLIGIHVHYPVEPFVHGPLADEEKRFLAARPRGRELGGAYSHVHRTRPLTLAYGLADSPVGLASWIVDKWWEWTDHDGDLERAVDRDDLLIALTLYWATGTIDSSLQPYREWGLGVAPELADDLYPATPPGVEPRPLTSARIDVPAGVALFDARYPRAFVERGYADLRRFTEMPEGGHFPALEQPALLVEELRSFFRLLR